MIGRKPVMFDRALRPEWIDFVLEKYIAAADEESLKVEVRAWMDAKALGTFTAQKSARQLHRTVGFKSPLSRERLESDYARLQRLSPEARNGVRLQLVADANEFFGDCVKAIRAMRLNGSQRITATDLYERLQAIYGHRGTIPRRVRSVLQTLALFECLINESRGWLIVEDSWLGQ